MQRVADHKGQGLYPFEVLKIAYEVYPEAASSATQHKGRDRKPRLLSPSWEGCHEKYRGDTFTFIVQKIVRCMADQRLARGLPPADTAENADEYDGLLDPDDRTCGY